MMAPAAAGLRGNIVEMKSQTSRSERSSRGLRERVPWQCMPGGARRLILSPCRAGRVLVHGHRDGSFCAAGLKPGLQGITARGAESDGDGDNNEIEGKSLRCTSRYS